MSRVQAKDPVSKEQQDELDSWDWRNGHRPQDERDWFAEVKAIEAAWSDYASQQWRIGKAPENPTDWENELKLRDFEHQKEVEQDERRDRLQREYETDTAAASGERIRSYVLLFVIAGVVATPIYAMIATVDAQAFSQYIAPITGIAGTVIGYWFGQRGAPAERVVPTPETTPAKRPPATAEATPPSGPAQPKPTGGEATPPSGPAQPKPGPS